MNTCSLTSYHQVFVDGTEGTRWAVLTDGRKTHSGLPRKTDAFRAACARMRADRPVGIVLADGSKVTVPAGSADSFLGLDADRNQVHRDPDVSGLVYALTPCCNATGKGASVPSGVVCRSCYREVDGYFGGQATVDVPRASVSKS